MDANHKKEKDSSGFFSVLTYNVAGLPGFISSAITGRSRSIAEIGKKINPFDIVNVQEDFNYNNSLYFGGNQHPYRTKPKGRVPFGDGLNTLSRFPMSDVIRVPWKKRTGADSLTPKGFTLVKVEIVAGIWLDVYNVHANAQNSRRASSARRDNLNQLRDYIGENSSDNALIVMGDFNAHYSFGDDNLHDFMESTTLVDSWVELQNGGLVPEAKHAFKPPHMLSIGNQNESIDKILYRSNGHLNLAARDYNIENNLFTNLRGLPLSDHYALAANFNWAIHP
ncbi:endonuclease/exonuclease/phosphatase family protein [Sphingobacterium detergens]|uniref:Endonuclease/exonuclease/phosphatase family metal-dependent hydrolase n=1 Tax=Sphingobacterium detergens TaxID=1145106 RepID=A0A420AQI9_SPHD1|nr:endonuclease/exonuclease/phosphatase family protein [Sphingobacterium detergens]RKE46717.1 endonuclease/exonuclease/phosphatase family metal-dependent hydrolase [Sphingobacterium detergens]